MCEFVGFGILAFLSIEFLQVVQIQTPISLYNKLDAQMNDKLRDLQLNESNIIGTIYVIFAQYKLPSLALVGIV
jgi:hypothetical protein